MASPERIGALGLIGILIAVVVATLVETRSSSEGFVVAHYCDSVGMKDESCRKALFVAPDGKIYRIDKITGLNQFDRDPVTAQDEFGAKGHLVFPDDPRYEKMAKRYVLQ